MKLISVRPTCQALIWISVLIGYAIVWPILQEAQIIQGDDAIYYAVFVIFILLFCIDVMLALKRPPAICISRAHETNISLGVEQVIQLTVENKSDTFITLDLVDDVPPLWRQLGRQLTVKIAAQSSARIGYKVLATRRGRYTLDATFVRLDSKFSFVQICWRYPLKTEVKVFPNFSAIAHVEGLNGRLNLTQAGLKKFNKRGSGMDFHQLREYRQGDTLRQLDWAATGRFNKLISREYQEEKNQNISILLDAGKRMCVKDGQMSYFDRALNALILLSYTVLKNSDQLSFMSFGESTRWLGKIKGVKQVSQILNHFFDLYPSSAASDYLMAAQALLNKQHKRSLVLLVTCLRDEDFSDLSEACRLLQKKHMVAVISVRETLYQEMRAAPVASFEQAISHSSAALMQQKINKQINLLRHQGVICFQVNSTEISSHILNTYLSIKKSGLL
ncbi:DUF58 domain-containing protein [Gayadomonas joobiniege]|uniref:DUF58 domain-containing protein n=1 Tax=Gayadomonas joobiniege TaxID=1234606 RepID=UPI0003689E99|nr:DUF58 domain-containing protein [Gayadomonas joobiniege]